MTTQSPLVFRFYLINFGWFSERRATTLEDARRVARDIGFECNVVMPDNSIIASWSPIGGWRERRYTPRV